MTAKFAGSGSVDDRRRRRLAQESTDKSTSTPLKRRRKPKSAKAKEKPDEIPIIKSDVVAAESIIPASIWKAFTISGAAFGFWGLLIWMHFQGHLPVELASIFEPRHGRGFQFLSVLALFETSQLAFLIYWYRSRSRKDFGGRYRVWGWAGLFWAVACFSTALEIHQPLALIASERWPIHFWRPEILYWFVPFSIGVLALHQLLALDMRLSKLSQSLWAGTMTIGLFAGSLTLGLDYVLPGSIRELICTSSVTCWQLLVMTTMLIHARYVVHVTNEAAPKRKTFLRRISDNIRVRTETLRTGLTGLTENRAEKKRERRERAASVKAERRSMLEAKRAEKEELAKESRDQAIADKKARQEDAKRKKEERLEQQKVEKANRLAQQEAAKAEREEAAARKKAEQEARKREKSKSIDGKASSSTQQKTSTDQPDHSKQEQTSATNKKRRKRVLGPNSRMDSAESKKKPHISSDRQDFDDYDEDDFDESRPMSKKERRRQRKQKRQRSQ